MRGTLDGAATQVAQLNERVATPVMFGGGTLAVVTGVGALARTTERRDELIATLGLVAPGNGLVFLEAAKTGAKGPSPKKLVGRARGRRRPGRGVRDARRPAA